MNVVDQLIHSTIRIQTDGRLGGGSGTGFFVNFANDGQSAVPAIVTNKHVVSSASSATLQFTRADLQKNEPILGSLVERTISSIDARWYFHPDPNVDLCIFPLAPLLESANAAGTPIFLGAFGMDDIADSTFLEGLVAIEDVLMIGYPSGLWDSKHNLPIVRRGVTATPPAVPFEGRQEFVVDCACFPGSSGSPVILFNPIGHIDKARGGANLGGRIKLLGVLWGGPQYDAIGEVKVLPVPTSHGTISHARIPMNLGYCVRANELRWFETELQKSSVPAEETPHA